MNKLILAASLAAVVSAGARAAQSPTQAIDSTSTARFEVASVKANKSDNPGGSLRRQPGGRIDAINMPLRMLILFAHQLQSFRLVGGPSWMATDRFDIVAKLEENPSPVIPATNPDALALAMQTLLAERFTLRVHHEVREMDIYALLVARPDSNVDPGLKRSTQDCSPPGVQARRDAPALTAPGRESPVFCGMQFGPGVLRFGGLPLSQLANALSGQVGRFVVDRTGLAGIWEFELTFAAAPTTGLLPGSTAAPADPDAPSIFTALREQLGLRLESTRGPVDVVVVDSLEQPTDD